MQAEHLYWVRPPRRGPVRRCFESGLPLPARQHAPRIQQLSDGLETLGLHPFHLSIGVDLTQDENGDPTPESRCIRCDRVDGFPCLVRGEGRRDWAVVRPALAYN